MSAEITTLDHDPICDDCEDKLLEPYDYLAKLKGKQIRVRLGKAFQLWLNISAEDLVAVTEITQRLHTASLLIDDIEDNSKMRRGVPVAHAVFGVPSTINTANYVYFQAMDQCRKMDNPQAMAIFIEELLNLHRGQGMDIYWREHRECPSEEEYMRMVSHKTGGLFRLAVRLMQSCSDDSRDFMPLVEALGQYFQILDDYINLKNPKYMENKGFCEDITEGKYAFPIIHAIHANPTDHRVSNILSQRTEDVSLKKYIVAVMEEMGSFEYTLTIINELKDRVMNCIAELGGNDLLERIITDLYEQVALANRPPST